MLNNKITVPCKDKYFQKSLIKYLNQFNQVFGFEIEYGTYNNEGIAKNEIDGAEYCWEFLTEQKKLVICTNNKFRENDNYLTAFIQMQQILLITY